MTKIYLDTEFTGLHQNTTLISLGLVSECNKTFYAEFTDFAINQLDSWLINNVIKNLKYFTLDDINNWATGNFPHTSKDKLFCLGHLFDPIRLINSNVSIYGNTLGVKQQLEQWLSQFDQIEIWSDCLSYDWVLFNNIFGTAFDIPKNVYYIPFDLSSLFKVKGIDPDINRETFVQKYNPEFFNYVKVEKHNALYDSLIIKECFNIVTNLSIKNTF